MALTGWSTSNYLRRTAAIKTTIPFYMSIWCYRATGATFNGLIATGTFGTNSNSSWIDQNDNNHTLTQNSGTTQADVATAFPNNAWFHVGGYFQSSTFRKGYMNAVSATNSGTQDPGTHADTVIGIRELHDIAFPNAGGLAEASFWDATGWATADADALDAKLYGGGTSGGNPLNITAESSQPWSGKLLAYWIDSANTITDLSGNSKDMTMVGTLTNFATGHPTIDAPSGGGPSADLMGQICL